jgi:hypothetical protein
VRSVGTRGAAIGLILVIAGCSAASSASPGEESAMRLTSATFAEGEPIPSEHTCDGADRSPPIAWSEAPADAAAFALIVEDPDAGNFVHWVLTGIPAGATELDAGVGDGVGQPGRNDFGRSGWGGPCPPSGEHRYAFTLYALSEPIEVGDSASAVDVRSAMSGFILAEARLTGRYARES